MYRLKAFVVCFLILGNCANFQSQKTIRFDDGRAATIFFNTRLADSGEKVFVVDFRNERNVTTAAEVERDVIEIWDDVKQEANSSEAAEGVINYSYSTGEKDKEGNKIFAGIIFIADRTESGEWSIKRAD